MPPTPATPLAALSADPELAAEDTDGPWISKPVGEGWTDEQDETPISSSNVLRLRLKLIREQQAAALCRVADLEEAERGMVQKRREDDELLLGVALELQQELFKLGQALEARERDIKAQELRFDQHLAEERGRGVLRDAVVQIQMTSGWSQATTSDAACQASPRTAPSTTHPTQTQGWQVRKLVEVFSRGGPPAVVPPAPGHGQAWRVPLSLQVGPCVQRAAAPLQEGHSRRLIILPEALAAQARACSRAAASATAAPPNACSGARALVQAAGPRLRSPPPPPLEPAPVDLTHHPAAQPRSAASGPALNAAASRRTAAPLASPPGQGHCRRGARPEAAARCAAPTAGPPPPPGERSGRVGHNEVAAVPPREATGGPPWEGETPAPMSATEARVPPFGEGSVHRWLREAGVTSTCSRAAEDAEAVAWASKKVQQRKGNKI